MSTGASRRAGRRQLKMDLVPVPDVLADPPRVLQILGSLFSNAVRFTEDGGTITMALQESFRELVEVANASEKGTVGVIALNGEPLVPALAASTSDPVELMRRSLHRGDVVLEVEPRWVVMLVLADAYIRKPFKAQELLDQIRALANT